jgi:hypothetical protein
MVYLVLLVLAVEPKSLDKTALVELVMLVGLELQPLFLDHLLVTVEVEEQQVLLLLGVRALAEAVLLEAQALVME